VLRVRRNKPSNRITLAQISLCRDIMADKAEVNSQHGSDVGACAELAFDDSSASLLPQLDSADIIPEAAMKCGILPLDGDTIADLRDNLPTESLRLYFKNFYQFIR